MRHESIRGEYSARWSGRWSGQRSNGTAGATVLLTLTLQGVAMSGARAQDEGNTSGALEEVVVTAQKVEQNLQDVPISITALTPEALETQGLTSMQGLDLTLPNVSIGPDTASGGGKGNYTIRGIGEALAQITKDQPVGIYVDEVFLPRMEGSLMLSLLDVERIEVLRGPQGTLFGRNTIGGAVHYVSRRPDFDGFSGQAKVTVGDFDRRDANVWANIPLTDTLATRISLGSFQRDGYVKRLIDGRSTGDEDTLGARVQLAWKPSDVFDMHLAVDWSRAEDLGGPTKLIGTRPDADTPRNYARDNPSAPRYTAENFVTPGFYTTVGGTLPFNETESTGASLIATLELNDAWQIKSITSARELNVEDFEDRDESILVLEDHRVSTKSDTFSQELQLLTQQQSWNGVLGLYFFDEQVNRRSRTHDALVEDVPNQLMSTFRSRLDIQSLAAFAQATFNLTDKLSLTAGVRYTRDEKGLAITEDGPTTGSGDIRVVPEGRFTPPLSFIPIPGNRVFTWLGTTSHRAEQSGDTFTNTTPRLALQYSWTDDIMTYVSANKGFRSGGFNDRLQVDVARNDIIVGFDPEEVWAYEAGVRADLLDRRLRVNVTGFFSDYKDIQVSLADPVLSTVVVDNGGDAEVRGAELELTAVPIDNLTLTGSYGYIEPEYTRLAPTVTDFTKDSEFGRTPKTSWSTGFRWDVPLSGGANIEFSGTYGWKARQRSTPQDFTHIILDSYGLLNLRLGYAAADNRWNVALLCTNCADKKYAIGGWGLVRDLDGPPDTPVFNPGPPPGIDPRSFLHFVSVGQEIINPGRPRELAIQFTYNVR